MPSLASGTVLDERYRIEASIGSGSFGVVYRALDLQTPAPRSRKPRSRQRRFELVAVKTLRARVGAPEMGERFAREAEICQVLSHPATARLRDAGTAPGEREAPIRYMVFDLVRGLPLDTIVDARGPLRLEEAVHVLVAVLASLGEAHSHGILHRDLKPANVLAVAPDDELTEPADAGELEQLLGVPPLEDYVWREVDKLEIKVLDFGLGKVLAIGERRPKKLTATGMSAGTPHYMAPEQIRGDRGVDYRADIYGCGMLLYRLLAGRPAFEGRTPALVAMKQLRDPLPELPGPLDAHPIREVFQTACAKDREERYTSADAMAWALQCSVDRTLSDAPEPTFEAPPEVVAPPRTGLLRRLFKKRGS